MREIKFRAWDKVNKCWLTYDEIFISQEGEVYEIEERTQGFQTYMNQDNMTEKVEINQYTGLKDKNGREIYEGDIVKITNPFAEDIISKVVWGGTEYPAFDLPKYDGDTMNAFSAIRFNGDDEMEVIGNVFEHPHLLEGDN